MRAEVVDGGDAKFEGVAAVDGNSMSEGFTVRLSSIDLPQKSVVFDFFNAHVTDGRFEVYGVSIGDSSLVGQGADGKLMLRHVFAFYQRLYA